MDEDRVQGGVRAAEVIATSCSTGVECTELQQAVVAHCIRDCESCDRTLTGTVLGSCTSDGRSAMSMISVNCDVPPPPRAPPPPVGEAGPPPPPPPPPPPRCSSLQSAVRDQCTVDCTSCHLDTVQVVLGMCQERDPRTGQYVLARDTLVATCANASPPPPVGPQRCTAVQQALIDDCSDNCLGCDGGDTNRALGGCLGEDGRVARAGVTFCSRDWETCLPEQHTALTQCLSNCAECHIGATQTLMGDCRAELDRVWGGVAAADLVAAECAPGVPCTDLQRMVATRCVTNCDGCDMTATGTVLGMCTEDSHGSAVEYITTTCNADDIGESQAGSQLDVLTGGQTTTGPPACTVLQSGVMTQCQSDCGACDVNAVRDTVLDCVMENGVPARDQMCMHVEFPPSTEVGACSPLQESVISHCTSDCMNCNEQATAVVLAECTIGGIVQSFGETFCIHGTPCNAQQHAALASCIANCDTCDHHSTSEVLGDCAADTDRVFGGVRAVELITTECATGVGCSPIQQAVVARCIADCENCDRMATGTVVGSCTEQGHGTALAYIEDSCSTPPPPPSPGGGQVASPPPPPPPPQCTALQHAVMDQCTSDCVECRVATVQTVLGDCVLAGGGLARDRLCAHVTVPPSHPEGVCTPLQNAVITHCEENCDSCDADSVETVLAGCTVAGVPQAKGVTFCSGASSSPPPPQPPSPPPPAPMCGSTENRAIAACSNDCLSCHGQTLDEEIAGCTAADGTAQEFGVTVCIRGSPCSPLQHAMLVRCLSSCGTCDQDATAVVLGNCMADTDQSAEGQRAVELIQTQCATGVPCSDLQQTFAARCVANCNICNRDATRQLLGSCTSDGHGTAANMVDNTCDQTPPP
eukprot:COSAG02_NODE_8030_length_2740_cov_2.164710_1_plen_869_part_01